MPTVRHVTPRNGDVVLLVGTMKGAFILRADARRRDWDVGGPYFPGHAVYALACDTRAGRHRLWAGPNSMHWGGMLRSSDDFGQTWTNPVEANVKFPDGAGAALKQIWQIVPGRQSEPDTLYCGVEPAAVFVSRDAGDTWALVEGLSNHPHRALLQPRAVRLRVRHGRSSGESRLRVDRAARIGRVPLHPRRQAARLPHARWGRPVGRPVQRPAAERRVRDSAARRSGGRFPGDARRLLRHAKRQAVRLGE